MVDILPRTDGALFDVLHEMFGWGDHDELVNGGKGWFKFKSAEVGKIKRFRARRHLSIAQLYQAADYCYRHGIYARNITEVARQLYAAERETRTLDAARHERELDAKVAEVLEFEGPGSEWFTRLARSSGSDREAVIEEWQKTRS